MTSTIRILLSEPNMYFALGFSHGLLTHFNNAGVDIHISKNLLDKTDCDMVFLAAEQSPAELRYLTRRRTAPAHQRILIFKEKPSQHDLIQFKGLDGIFYRHQSMSWAMQIASQTLRSMIQPEDHYSHAPTHRLLLTLREIDVLRCLSQGQRACQVSHYLRISAKTVSAHKRNAMAKLGLTRTTDLNYWLLRGGIEQIATHSLPTAPPWNASAKVSHRENLNAF